MPDIIEHLEITTLTNGGRGLGHHDGKAVFVPLTVPGDIVRCQAIRTKKSFVEADLLDIVRPSPARRDAPCPYFGDCGGCQWQQIPYVEQSRWKGRLFNDLFLRNGLSDESSIKPIVASGAEWHYRNRVQFKCGYSASGITMGFFRHGTHEVVDVDHCLLIDPRIQDIYAQLRRNLAGAPRPESVKQIDAAVGDDGQIRLLFHLRPESVGEMCSWLSSGVFDSNPALCVQSGAANTLRSVSGESSLSLLIDDPPLTLKYGPGGFVQVNSSQNQAMIREMLSLLSSVKLKTVLDLFCGMGNFSLPLALNADLVIGVEDHVQSIEYARMNAAANGIHNIEFHAVDAAKFIKKFHPGDIDLVVLDPPRSGHFRVVSELLEFMPSYILYVSCDPMTLARDLKPLVKGGYRVVSTRPFDLFPQTWHVESMTLLKKL